MCSIPAVFMSAVTTAYILQAPEGFRLPAQMSNIAGIAVSIVFLGLFMKNIGKQQAQTKKSTAA
jgi:hypothetical protein